MPFEMSRDDYARHYGPTEGDRVRLGDTDLWVRVEADDMSPGDEPLWGYGKNLRSRMTQYDRVTRDSELDILLNGVLVIDPIVGIRKTSIGIKDGRIAGIGRAGSPAQTRGVDLVIGPNTLAVTCNGLIATAGAIDSHVHLLTPRLVPVALSAGVTTLITAGFEEPPYLMDRTLQAFEHLPVNIGLMACGRADVRAPVEEVIEAGACGIKIHEDFGSYPEIIDSVLRVADDYDVAVALHTDGLNESCEVEDTVAAIDGRAVHAYHIEGSGGGHIPDLMLMVREPNIICSSTTPTLPYARDGAAEQAPMILAVHGMDSGSPEDWEAARERVHEGTMAAEGPLHDLGAISIINSDSQGMGRIGETVRRTWQLAHEMKRWRSTRGEVMAGDDNERILQYLAKYTCNPARTHGIAHEVGSLEPGLRADIVLWEPAFFGVKPAAVLKGGTVAWGAVGDGNASIDRCMPVTYGPMWGGLGRAAASTSVIFSSQAGIAEKLAKRLGTAREVVAIEEARGVRKSAMLFNHACPPIEIDAATAAVSLTGERLASEPVTEVRLNRLYLLS